MPNSPGASARASGLCLLLALTASCGAPDRPAPSSAPASPAAAPRALHAVDPTAMDPSVSPGTDFYLYANGAWLARTEIPADRSSTGVKVRLTEIVEERSKAILE